MIKIGIKPLHIVLILIGLYLVYMGYRNRDEGTCLKLKCQCCEKDENDKYTGEKKEDTDSSCDGFECEADKEEAAADEGYYRY